MKLPILIAFYMVMIYSYAGFGMSENTDKLELVNFTQTEQQDSLTVTVFVSFVVNENGKVGQPKVEKTECSKYDIKELDKKAVEKLEKEALRVVAEMDDLDPIEKPAKYTQPIKMRLPIDGYLRKGKNKN